MDEEQDPYIQEWQLHKEGVKQHYSLGRFLRRRYTGFLSERYVNTEIMVYSSYIQRCLMSAYANLAGLYPPRGKQLWNSAIPWQPIPVRTRPLHEDSMLSMAEACPRYDQLKHATMNSTEVQRELVDDKEFYNFISEKTGIKDLTLLDAWKVADTMYCEQQHNVSRPEWVNNTIWDRLSFFRWYGFNVLYNGNDEQRRLTGGPLLKDWIELTKQKIADPDHNVKMNMFSAHDSTVVAITSALKIFNKQPPPYTTAFIMELHQTSEGDFHVELYFRNRTSMDPNDDAQPYQMTIPGCNFKCPFEKFVSLTAHNVPADWESECTIGLNTETPIPCQHSAGAISFYSSCLVWLSLVYVWHSLKNC